MLRKKRMNNGERKERKYEKNIGSNPKKREDRERSRSFEDHECSKQEDVGEGVEKKARLIIGSQDREREDMKKKRKKWNMSIRKGEASLREKKRRRTTTEDIRVFFGTEDSH